ncbi:MAG: ABC transporter ATP-binding protein [Bryobacteraceae bacterium]
MLEIRGLTKLYVRRPAVDDVSFVIQPGEILGYLGPNGSGKSTTVKMLTGLLEPSRGVILYDGGNIRQDLIRYKKVLGYVPEEPNLYPYLTGREYLQLVGRLRCLPANLLEARIDQLLNLLSLFEHRYSPISSYSKGMKQKVLISAALLHNPDVLVFDEPLSGLDVTTALVFKNLLKVLARQGKIILYSSHVLEVVEKVCTSVIILRKGCVVANDSVEHLRGLMALPSLEDIFSQLVLQEDTEKIASDIVEVMQS